VDSKAQVVALAFISIADLKPVIQAMKKINSGFRGWAEILSIWGKLLNGL
jgi:hypothetical protein